VKPSKEMKANSVTTQKFKVSKQPE